MSWLPAIRKAVHLSQNQGSQAKELAQWLRSPREAGFIVRCSRHSDNAVIYRVSVDPRSSKAAYKSKSPHQSGGVDDWPVPSMEINGSISDPKNFGVACLFCDHRQIIICGECGQKSCGTDHRPWRCTECGNSTDCLTTKLAETLKASQGVKSSNKMLAAQTTAITVRG